eukprot:4873302-Pyramimonas_sp.AAC.1
MVDLRGTPATHPRRSSLASAVLLPGQARTPARPSIGACNHDWAQDWPGQDWCRWMVDALPEGESPVYVSGSGDAARCHRTPGPPLLTTTWRGPLFQAAQMRTD